MRGRTSTVLTVLGTLVCGISAHGAPLRDVGIFSDLDDAIAITLPPAAATRAPRLQVDPQRGLLLLYDGEFPLKAFALQSATASFTKLTDVLAALPAPSAAELAPWFTHSPALAFKTTPLRGNERDLDGDGIPNPLDVLLGARKLVANHAAYTEGYYRIAFPQGDVPRHLGVCTDTIIRAFRNAGLDLQARVADDVRKAVTAYGIRKPDANIDHRRVRTLLVWFRRHMPQIKDDTPRPGDVVFLDTFPTRAGPDHVGIISDRLAPSGLPFVINNWTVGYQETEMDLLPTIAVTHRFRLP